MRSGTSPRSADRQACRWVKDPARILGEPLGAHCLSQPVASAGWRSWEVPGHNARQRTLDLCAHPCPRPRPQPPTPSHQGSHSFFLDLLYSTRPLTSGQNPCVWFSVTIILVMMTNTEVPLGGEEWGEKTRSCAACEAGLSCCTCSTGEETWAWAKRPGQGQRLVKGRGETTHLAPLAPSVSSSITGLVTEPVLHTGGQAQAAPAPSSCWGAGSSASLMPQILVWGSCGHPLWLIPSPSPCPVSGHPHSDSGVGVGGPYLGWGHVIRHVHDSVGIASEALHLGYHRGLDGRVSHLVCLLVQENPAGQESGDGQQERRVWAHQTEARRGPLPAHIRTIEAPGRGGPCWRCGTLSEFWLGLE